MFIKQNQTIKFLLIFLILHTVIWTLIPTISNDNLHLDTIEALAWGSNLDWGFNKHPPLSAFFVEIIYQIFGNQDWAYYFLSQIFVIISFIVVWKFSEKFFKNKIYSLLSVLLLEGIYFYNYTTPEFNVYVCTLPFWSLTVFYCWEGIQKNNFTSWLLFGFFAGLGVLYHYLFLYILFAFDIFFIYLILKKKIDFKCLVSLFSFFIVLLPHLIWLENNNFITINYGLHRTGVENSSFFMNHLSHPFIFLGKQIGILIPFFVMFLFIISKIKIKINLKDKRLLFLITVTVVPVILIFLTSLFMGIKIRTMWMTSFYLFIGVLFLYIYNKKINLKKLKLFLSIFLILFIFSPTAYFLVSTTQKDKRTDYPGKKIAMSVDQEWNNFVELNKTITYKKVDVVGWDEWYAGNLSYYLGGVKRPKVYMEDFADGVAYRKENERNFILISKNEKPIEVCSLDLKHSLNDYLKHIINVVDHNVCFLILKSVNQ